MSLMIARGLTVDVDAHATVLHALVFHDKFSKTVVMIHDSTVRQRPNGRDWPHYPCGADLSCSSHAGPAGDWCSRVQPLKRRRGGGEAGWHEGLYTVNLAPALLTLLEASSRNEATSRNESQGSAKRSSAK